MSTADWAACWAGKYDLNSLRTRTLARLSMLASGAEIEVSVADALGASAELGADFIESMRDLAHEGWIAPIEEMADGSIRTTLRVPEGAA